MKNFASLRGLTLAPRKKSSLGSLALLLCATGSILTLGQDAGAVAGAPAFPNLNFVNTGAPGTPPTQPAYSPLMFNLYNILNQPGVAAAPVLPGASSLPIQNFDSSHRWASAPVVAALTPHSYAPTQGDLNHFVTQPGLIKTPSMGARTRNADGTPVWNGQGDMPNSFQAPWHFAQTSFDPTFRTPYWNEQSGFINDSFELGLAGTDYGRSIFNRGLAYAGKPDFSSVLPVWGGDGKDVTQALFPATPARASAAL